MNERITIGWISWLQTGEPKCSRQHIMADHSATKTLCGKLIPEAAACDDGASCDDQCKVCKKIADKRERAEEVEEQLDVVFFTPREHRALNAVIAASADNGHDFGVTEDVVAILKADDLTPQQVGGLLSSLQAKGVFAMPPTPCDVNGEYTVHQYELIDRYKS